MDFHLNIYIYIQISIYNEPNVGPVVINSSKIINAHLFFSKNY